MNKKAFSLMLILGALILLTGCGPSDQDLLLTALAETETRQAFVSASQTAEPTATLEPEPTSTPTQVPTPSATSTPLPSSTPTTTPSATPTTTPTIPPTPVLPLIYGNLQVNLVPYGEGAEIPEDLGELTLFFKGELNNEEYRVQITEPNGGYSLNMPQGPYKISRVDIGAIAEDISTGGPMILVPEEGCIYVGRLVLSYFRLPPLSIPEQIALVQQAAAGQDVLFKVLESGGLALVLGPPVVELPETGEQVAGAEACAVQLITPPNPD